MPVISDPYFRKIQLFNLSADQCDRLLLFCYSVKCARLLNCCNYCIIHTLELTQFFFLKKMAITSFLAAWLRQPDAVMPMHHTCIMHIYESMASNNFVIQVALVKLVKLIRCILLKRSRPLRSYSFRTYDAERTMWRGGNCFNSAG